nr:CBL-interacting serine/threonine-protein kinase 24-like [Tanacetum cinerariifolium]
VLSENGYDGAAVDIWSCGVILYVLLAGYLPFEESNLASLYKKVNAADFSYPFWFPHNAKSLIDRILDPNPETRIRIDGIREHPWFQVNYRSISHTEDGDVSLDDVQAVFDGIEDQVKRQTRFVSRKPAKDIISTIEAVAELLGFKVQTRGYKTRLEGASEIPSNTTSSIKTFVTNWTTSYGNRKRDWGILLFTEPRLTDVCHNLHVPMYLFVVKP